MYTCTCFKHLCIYLFSLICACMHAVYICTRENLYASICSRGNLMSLSTISLCLHAQHSAQPQSPGHWSLGVNPRLAPARCCSLLEGRSMRPRRACKIGPSWYLRGWSLVDHGSRASKIMTHTHATHKNVRAIEQLVANVLLAPFGANPTSQKTRRL